MTAPLGTRAERYGRRAVARLATDQGARWAWRTALVVSIPVFVVIGRRQWFNRDDWAFVLTREEIRSIAGWDNWLFDAQDGHWLTVPILLFELVGELFGIESYWPFLVLALASHAGAVALARQVCIRVGVSPWTTTLLASSLLLFGPGWHNIVFAIQVCYSLSVCCFLGQILLVDHAGPIDRRDVIAAAVGLVGVTTSGFGPIFMVGVAALLVLRRRWLPLVVVIGPSALAYGWWTLTWAHNRVNDTLPGDRPQVPAYVVRGVSATFEGLVAFPSLAGIAIVATLAVMLGGTPWPARRVSLALAATVLVMFAGIGWERIGFGVPSAGSSRYVDVAALVIVPAFGLAVDRARRLGPEALGAVRLVLVVALVVNVGTLRSASATFARASRHEQLAFSLVAGADHSGVPDTHVPVPNSPDVIVADLARLVAEGAITPRQPAGPGEQALLQQALTTGVVPAAMP